MNEFQMEVLRQVVGHCSHNIGWDGIHASSLDLLSEVLQKYITEIGRLMHIYSEQFGRTAANLDDLGLTFRDMGITIQDLSDFVSNVEPTCFHHDIAKFPIPREHTLNFLKPGSNEVLTRPVHIHEHLPPMQHITLGDEKNSGETKDQDDDENLNVTVAENTEIILCSTSSPRAYPFKRPDGAEKRKGWLDDEGQAIREISSVMMTTSGYLSSSREGKLPDTKLRKTSTDPELDSFPTAEKKVNMKKVFEGIKKLDERNSDFGKKPNEIPKDREVGLADEKKVRDVSKENEEAKKERSKEKIERGKERDSERKNDFENLRERSYEMVNQHDMEKEKDPEKETEVEKVKEHEKEKEQDKVKFSDKEKEREKEKLKKKRGKEKLLEEFAFFEKEKVVSLKISEPVSSVDSTKQKLNIFKKRTSKTRDQDNQTSRISLHASESTEISSNNVIETFPGGSSKSHTEGASPSKTEFFCYEEPKITKKERKLKNKKDRYDYSSEAIGTLGDHHKRKPGKDFLKGDAYFFKSESLESIESSSFGKVNQNKINKPTANDNETPKKKRGRPRELTPEHTKDCHSSEFVATHVESAVPSIQKPFLHFPSHFPVPGLIPPQFIPLNLLGIPPMGLRPPLGIPPTISTSSNAMNTTLSPGTHHVPQKGDSSNRVESMVSPTSKSLNIVDSLTEATDMSLDVLSCEEDSNVNKKKEKRDKKEKEKRKKDKKLKGKISDELERKAKREKKKEKKEKEKERERPEKKDKEENITVPKITFKFAAAPTSPPPSALETTPKLILKAISDREGNFTTPTSGQREPISQSPGQPSVEVAKFSALITRPPKLVKSVKKEIPPSGEVLESPCNSQLVSGVVTRTPSPSSKIRREKPQKPPRVTKEKEKEKEKEKKKTDKPGDVAVITETVGSYYDEFGNKIWICPACGRQDDGTPMIGCDECDDWYHWVCVGIRVPPAETESWFCQRCIAKKQGPLKEKKKARKKNPV